ncbi:MAG: PEGA domain-containing protein [Bacteroidales bacterium]|nr:PEGA domain-containing protein [Bacteroidales bacterium]
MNTFNKALATIVKQYGIKIISDMKVINMLLDYNAFSDFPAAKQILKSMIEEGVCSNVVNVASPHGLFRTKKSPEEIKLQIAKLSSSFCTNSGYKEDLVNYVFGGFLYSMGIFSQSPDEQKVEEDANKDANSEITQFLIVNISPKNSDLYIDDVIQVTQNGVWVGELPLGLHSYKVEKLPFHEDGKVQLTETESVKLDINLLKQSASGHLVTITTEEDDTEIFVDRVNVGRGFWEGQLSKGDHCFEARKDKYYPLTKRQVIDSNQDVVFSSLKPITGSVSVNVSPVGSNIYLNGRSVGCSPMIIRDVPIGQKFISVKTEEGTEFKTVVDVKENQTTPINECIDTLFFDDYSNVKIGDFFYEDGTLSHVKASNKKCIGIVFSTKPDKSDAQKGWSHGCIVSAMEEYLLPRSGGWGDLTIPLPADFSKDSETDIRHYITSFGSEAAKSGYVKCNIDIIKDNPLFDAIYQASMIKSSFPLPKGKTSGWYLPTIQQLIDLFFNIFEATPDNQYGPSVKIKESIEKSIMPEQRKMILSSYHTLDGIWSSSIDENGAPYSAHLVVSSVLFNTEKSSSSRFFSGPMILPVASF